MADKTKESKETKVNKETKAAAKDGASDPASVKIGVLAWVIMITIVALLSSSGFVLGHLLAGGAAPLPAGAASTPENASAEAAAAPGAPESPESKNKAGVTWYYNDLESVVVNPNEPGATRFVRVGLRLEMSEELSQEAAKALLETKSPLLINWLNLYLKGLSLSQMQNEKDMNRLLLQIGDAFNEILFPNAKPQIKKVLIREFNIQ